MKLPQHLSSARSEAGETLIEVLMASALMAVVVLAIIGGITTMLIGAKVHRDQTDGNAALTAAMEGIKSPSVTPTCDAASDPANPYRTAAGLPSTVSIQNIEYEVNRTNVNTGERYVDFDASAQCSLPPGAPDPTASPLTLQRITLQYTSTDNRVTPTLSFIKGAF